MTKSLGPFDFGHERQRAAARDGKRKRSLVAVAFDAFFPLLMVPIAYLIARTFFGF